MSALRVLHIDDESDILELAAISLGLDSEFEGARLRFGQRWARRRRGISARPHLLDVMMPVMDGPATLRDLQENPETTDIPVVFMTARVQTSELEHFKSLGVAGVITKPFDPMTLAASVRSYMHRPIQGELASS
jgi:CheY-like chemotaxis protein